jgi:hypothetical protein
MQRILVSRREEPPPAPSDRITLILLKSGAKIGGGRCERRVSDPLLTWATHAAERDALGRLDRAELK